MLSPLKPAVLPAPRRLASLCCTALLALAGCSSVGPVAKLPLALSDPSPVSGPAEPALVASPSQTAPPAANAETSARLLEDADRIRGLTPSERAQEIARLGEPHTPADAWRLALLLGQTHQSGDLARAQALLDKLQTRSDGEALKLQPLARLLAARYAEQRRLEDQLERQNLQLRDVQKRLDQTHDKLQALMEIERSLSRRASRASRTGAVPALSTSKAPSMPSTSSTPSAP